MYETILYEISGSVAQLTMNRPDKYNAFTGQMLEEMSSALKKAARDEEVRCILLTGAGKAFNAGQDLGDVLGADTQETASSHGEVLRKRYNPLIMQICNMEKPVIAVINGAAAGAGMSIALACDLRIMSEKAYFVNAFVSIGLVPDSGGCYFLPRLVGLGKAMELAITGERISAEEAYRIGLANRVCSAEQFSAEAGQLAAKLAQMPTRAIGLIKRTMHKGLDMSLAQVLEYEAYAQEIAGNTEDHREGIQAFLEKRLPLFKGV
ncbi:2-(1,2-epoxy-1,2-dihydrophenyl)acetyl-CoA isomerase [Paenibacillus larvae subsp. pulvifaciens]|uniref:2-(1,2-epoxy-1,2-dihydrophenyl)acetyl-CoA isomerase n=1 Tax=Paenibacillus larvae subsp. pulvifaciens TaxID=1477 RepID=A0A1V0UPY7_9BACL|nr:enoyl-CoA hydratase-related protein [Paenibacillus larvae]ARF67339.1 2-(1,2-epoxy-1,2-dihydrophenyl)acetyl-CoA isomerase [Paenibacillus larvae subsp. pulvifaciens]